MIAFNVVGLVFIGLIIWWFWLYKPTQVAVGEGDLVVTVENGFILAGTSNACEQHSCYTDFFKERRVTLC
jgi:hypothetical protein